MKTDLKLDIDAMIRNHDALVSLEASVVGIQPMVMTGEQAGMVIGAYTLVEALGEGGGGTVWLAFFFMHLKRPTESEALYRRELEALRKQHGPEHPDIVLCLDNFGMQLVSNGKYDEAEQVLIESNRQGRKFFGDRNPYEDHALARLAIIAARRGDEETQLKHLRDGVAVTKRVYPKGHGYRKEALTNLTRALTKQAEKYEKLGDAASVEKAKARRQELERLRAEDAL